MSGQPVDTTLDPHDVPARLGAAARALGRLARGVAVAGLVGAVSTAAALAPWLPGWGAGARAAGLVLAALVVAAAGRVWWHGRVIAGAYGDPVALTGVLDAVPAAFAEATATLAKATDPERARGRIAGAWAAFRAVRALRRLWDAFPLRDRIDALARPVRPASLHLTLAAAGLSTVTAMAGPPAAVVSLLVAVAV